VRRPDPFPWLCEPRLTHGTDAPCPAAAQPGTAAALTPQALICVFVPCSRARRGKPAMRGCSGPHPPAGTRSQSPALQTPLPLCHDLAGSTGASACTAPSPQPWGQKGADPSPAAQQREPDLPQNASWAGVWCHTAAPQPLAKPGLWDAAFPPGLCTGQGSSPSAPPQAGGIPTLHRSAPRSVAAGKRGQACMHGREPTPCTSPDRCPWESVSSDTWIFACRVPGWLPGAASSSKACFGSDTMPRSPDAELVLHLHLDYVDRGRLLLREGKKNALRLCFMETLEWKIWRIKENLALKVRETKGTEKQARGQHVNGVCTMDREGR